MEIILLVAGLAIGALIAFFAARRGPAAGPSAAEAIYKEKLAEAAATERELREHLDNATRALGKAEGALESEIKKTAEKQALLQEAEKKLSDTFSALSTKTLQATTAQFLELAKATFATEQEASKGDLEKRQIAIDALVKPVAEALEKMGVRLTEIEQTRVQSYGALFKQVESLGERSDRLSSETANLVGALKNPSIRGRWGESTLRRTFEIAGLNAHIDFEEQAHVVSDGESFRPDAVIRLPGGRSIVVDAKAPADAYFRAHESTDAGERARQLADHAQQLRGHIRRLSAKGYGAKVEGSPEFVLLFIPNEGLLSAAVEADSELLDFAAQSHIALATPMIFQAMLWVIAYAWRQEALAANSREIAKLGADLHDRIATVAKHIGNIGDALNDATNAYNKSISSLQTRLLPTTRKIRELDVLPTVAPEVTLERVEVSANPISSPELLGPGDVTH